MSNNDEYNSSFNSEFIDNIIEKNLRYVFITDELNDKDKEMIHILLNMQKKKKFRELKYIFINSLMFTVKDLIDNSSSENDNSTFYKQSAIKIISYFSSMIFNTKITTLYTKEESEFIPELVASCSKKFSLQLTHYILKEFENNYGQDPTTIKFLYRENYDNILNVYKGFIEVCYAYIKIVTKLISLYIAPIFFRELSFSTYFKTTFASIYNLTLFHYTYKNKRSNDTTSTHDNCAFHIDDFFDNLYKIIEKDTLSHEIKILNKILTQDIFSNGIKKYEFQKFSKEYYRIQI